MKGLSILWSRINHYANCIALLVLMLVYLSPIIYPMYFSDDAFVYLNSLIDNKVIGSKAWWMQANEVIDHWTKINGRFNPLAIYTYHFLIYNCQPAFVKWIYFLTTCLTLIVASSFVKILVKRHYFELFILFALSCIQFCIRYHDPYNSFGLLYHSILILNFLSLILFNRYLQTGKWYTLIFSIVFFLLGLLYQEIAIIFVVLHIILVYKTKKGPINLWPILLISSLFLFFIIILRLNVDTTGQYVGLKSEFNLGNNLYVLYAQVLGSIPLRSSFCARFDLLAYSQLLEKYWIDILVIFSSSFYILKTSIQFPIIKMNRYMILSAFCLILLPALAISFSAKYIKEVHECNFYIPVFIQIFGMAILLYGLFIQFMKFRLGLMIILPMVLSLSYLTNRIEVNNGIDKHYRHLHVLKELGRISKVSQSNDTVFTYNMWTEEKVMEKLTELYFNKKIVYKNIYTMDSTLIYPKILAYSATDTPKFLFFKNYKYKIKDFE